MSSDAARNSKDALVANDVLTSEQLQSASARRSAFLAAIPKPMLRAEDELPAVVAVAHASTRSKLHRIYQLADEISRTREPFVACAKGCSSCCHMNVNITIAEADRLGRSIGRQPTAIHRSIHRPPEHFAGQPCTFLGPDGTCAVYTDRPLVCRTHASHFEDSVACHPDVMNRIEVPQVEFSGLDKALFLVSEVRGEVILADIRDFFPAQK